jgi:DNA processing protein
MEFTTEKEACLALLIAAGGDVRQLKAAVKTHRSALAAAHSPSLRARLKQGIDQPAIAQQVQQQMDLAHEFGARWITPSDEEFPVLLNDCPLLSVRGTLVNVQSVAIVGTRNADAYGLAISDALAKALASCGITVVSGAAAGIDESAHRAVIAASGQTVAVLGTGLMGERSDKKNEFLDEIAQNGAVVSEFLITAHGARWTFPLRNQVIAGMCYGTVVVQAGKKSGALLTARAAKTANRPVYAVPGDVVHPLSQGTNQLIASGDARILATLKDLSELTGKHDLQHAPWPSAARDQSVTPVSLGLGHSISETGLVLDLLQKNGELRSDQIEHFLPGLAIPVAELLLDLELKGQVMRVQGDCYAVNKEGVL